MVLDTIAIEIQRTWKAHRRYHESLIKNRKLRLAQDYVITALATDFVTLPIGEWIALPYPLAFESFHFAMSFPRLLSHNLKNELSLSLTYLALLDRLISPATEEKQRVH